MKGPPLGPGGEDITWPDQVAPRARKASSTHKMKHQTSNSKRAHRRMGVKWASTPHTQHHTPSGHTAEREPNDQGHRIHSTSSVHTGEREPTGQGHRTRNTTHGAGTSVNGSAVAKDTTHRTQHTKQTQR